MTEIKTVPISRSLLTQVPSPVETKPDNGNDARDLAFQQLKQQIDYLQQQVAFLATFESNLIDSFNQEIELLRGGASITQNEMQKRSFNSIAESLERVRDRWVDGVTFVIDRKKMTVVKKKVSDE